MIDSPDRAYDPRPVRLIPCWIALAILLVFGSLARCGFTEWDDSSTLARNPDFNPPTARSVLGYWSRPHMGLYVPVTYGLWGLIAKVAQGDLPNGVGSDLKPAPFHTANILLHLCSAWLVYVILRRLVKSPWPAAIGAMLFALHPVQVEPVAWASGLKDLLCGTLSLLAVWRYLIFAGNQKRQEALFATLAFTAAILAKPTAIVLPLMVVALDIWMLKRPWRRVMTLPAIWCVLAMPVAVVTGRVQQVGMIPHVAIWQRPLIAWDALAFYVRHLILPLQLAVDYARRPAEVLAGHAVWFAWLIPAAAVFAIYQRRRSHPWLIAAGLVFLAPLLPVLGLRPFMMQYTSTVADHYLYLPMFGVALAVAVFLARQSAVRWNAAAAMLIAVLAIRSSWQTKYWKDDETVNRHTLAVTPRSFTAHINLAHDLEMKGEFEAELQEDAAAVRCNPDFAMARGNYAVMLATLGHVDEAEAQCRELHRLIAPLPPKGQKVFTATFAFVGRELLWHHQPGRAMAQLREALRLDPNCADAAADLGQAVASLDTGS